jgi:hypothetical protein
LVSQVSNVLSISLRLNTSQLVVKVSHMQRYAQFLSQLNQNMEQAD